MSAIDWLLVEFCFLLMAYSAWAHLRINALERKLRDR